MRKLLIGAIAVIALVATAAVAIAQNPAPVVTTTGSISPSKAGTKRKPKGVNVTLASTNSPESRTTASNITVFFPKEVKLSAKGFPTCKAAAIDAAKSDAACPRGSKVGSGTASAILVSGGARLAFTNTAYADGPNTVAFFISQNGGSVRRALLGTVSRAGGAYGQKISIEIPADLQQPAPGVFSALTGLKTKFGAKFKKGRKTYNLLSSTGCPRGRKLKFNTKVTYAANPATPPVASAEGSATVNCRA